jgi:hypothetical protein
MTKVLGHIPMPVLYGVFMYMGIAALSGKQNEKIKKFNQIINANILSTNKLPNN